ncbi:hypothetical protein [Granulicella arctica]|uniref:hypothetical protein n=1 Tax=Granulicella arctica TaxID=940613 RepID=UPI0021E0CA79|nr:hypothetical protein [Granulicella arctica]
MHQARNEFSSRSPFGSAEATGYTFYMDSVRFGKALGIGARHAAKALIDAAEAASASPPAPVRTSQNAQSTQAARSGEVLGQRAARTTAKARQTKEGFARGSKRFGEAVWGPFVKVSGVLWLELTGVFFGLFLLTALINAWKLRFNLHDIGSNHEQHQHLLFSIAMALVFGYFCISSFVRASHKQHRS